LVKWTKNAYCHDLVVVGVAGSATVWILSLDAEWGLKLDLLSLSLTGGGGVLL
jgi:hypothetical protein